MPDSTSVRSLVMAEAPPEGQELSEPFAVLYAGDFIHGGLEIGVSEADLDNAIANFSADQAAGYEPSVDWEHSFQNGGGSRAAGWIKQLWRDGQKLMARVKWTATARQQIGDGEYKYLSPEFTTDAADETGKRRGFALLAAGLTNRPHLKALGAVALSEDTAKAIADDLPDAVLDKLAERLDRRRGIHYATGAAYLPPTITITTDSTSAGAQLLSERRAQMSENDKPKTVTLTEREHTDLVEKAGKADEVSALSERISALTDAVEAQKTRADESEQALNAERLQAALAQARREGRIDASDETTTKWTERCEKIGLDEVKSLLQEFPAETIAMSERGHGEDKPAATTAPEGVSPESHKLDARATEIAREREIPYEEAVYIAFEEVGA